MAEQITFSKNTEELIRQYLETINTQHDKLARRRVFNDFYKVENKDLLSASESTYKHYHAVLKERVYRGEKQQLTAIKEIKFLAAFLSWCEKQKDNGNKLVPKNTTNHLRNMRLNDGSDSFRIKDLASMSEIDKLVGWLRVNDRPILAACMLAMKCFLKTSEILCLKGSDIVSEYNGKCFIMPAKREKPILVPAELAVLLDEMIAVTGDGFLFPSNRPGHCSNAWISKRLRLACEKAGTRSMTFNGLRSMGAVVAGSNGADINKLNEDMGLISKTHIRKLIDLPFRYCDTGDKYVNILFKTSSESESKADNPEYVES